MYRYLAHDPLLTGDAHHYIDNFGLRARRILVPALARLLAMGWQSSIDAAYIVLFWAACFAGTYYTARATIGSPSVSPSYAVCHIFGGTSLASSKRYQLVDVRAC